MKKRRRRYLDQVHIRRMRQFLKRMRPMKQQLLVDRRRTQPRIHLVEMRLAL